MQAERFISLIDSSTFKTTDIGNSAYRCPQEKLEITLDTKLTFMIYTLFYYSIANVHIIVPFRTKVSHVLPYNTSGIVCDYRGYLGVEEEARWNSTGGRSKSEIKVK